jgi:hypothetical protein
MLTVWFASVAHGLWLGVSGEEQRGCIRWDVTLRSVMSVDAIDAIDGVGGGERCGMKKFVGSMMVLSLVFGVGVCDAGAKAKKVVKKKTTIVIKVKASYGRRYGIEASTAPAPDVSTRTGISNPRSGTGVAAGIALFWFSYRTLPV